MPNQEVATVAKLLVEELEPGGLGRAPAIRDDGLTSSEHETTVCSLSELMLGRELRLPIDLLFFGPREETLPSPTEYPHRVQERMEQAHDLAKETLKIESDRQKSCYDFRVDRCLYCAGDVVWLYNPRRKKGVTPKLQRPWEGPYLVTKRISDVLYCIQMTKQS